MQVIVFTCHVLIAYDSKCKKHFSVVTTTSQDYEECYFECAGDAGFPLRVFFLDLKCLRRWLFQASYLTMPPHTQLNPKRCLTLKGSLLNLHAKHLESSHK